MEKRKGNWIQTFTGKRFYAEDIRPEDICIEDIAHSLSLQCRYNGHCKQFYSVGQHSLIISEYLEGIGQKEFALEGLMHDGPEAYLCDVPRPIKPLLKGYFKIEDELEKIVYDRFNIASTKESRCAVKKVDNGILVDEMRHLFDNPKDWALVEPPLGVKIANCSMEGIKKLFLERFRELTEWQQKK